ncbi:MAG: hypothetical protein MJ192_08180, partial [Clostridia bacterium]|nr:hypothetical protein [Clostridia bacterium]
MENKRYARDSAPRPEDAMQGSALHPLKPFLKEGLKDPKNFQKRNIDRGSVYAERDWWVPSWAPAFLGTIAHRAV